MDIKIPEKDLKGFNDKAKKKLEEITLEFIKSLIEEVNRLESSRNTSGDDPEITSSMVNDAWTLIRMGFSQSKKNLSVKVLRVVSAVLSLLVGIFYNPTKLQNSGYMLFFIILVTVTILSVTISTIKE